MIPHEKRVVGRQQAFVEDRHRRFQLRRTGRQADQRALLRVLHQRPAAVGERVLKLPFGTSHRSGKQSTAKQGRVAEEATSIPFSGN